MCNPQVIKQEDRGSSLGGASAPHKHSSARLKCTIPSSEESKQGRFYPRCNMTYQVSGGLAAASHAANTCPEHPGGWLVSGFRIQGPVGRELGSEEETRRGFGRKPEILILDEPWGSSRDLSMSGTIRCGSDRGEWNEHIGIVKCIRHIGRC